VYILGPLAGVKVVEIAGRGPGPFAGMMLADMGADVIRVDRLDAPADPRTDPALEFVNRGRRSVSVDLKAAAGRELVLRLTGTADIFFEGFRPGVAERLGIGPADCLARNGALVYGRVTGWGQSGPLAMMPGHDINYIALSGALSSIGRAGGPPVPPLNLAGDNAGGMLLAFGLVCGVLEARSSGRGQVVDAAMLDGASLLMTLFHGRRQMGLWSDERGTNLLDSGYPFYDTYQTADGGYVAVGAIEAKFRAELLARLEVSVDDLRGLPGRSGWPETRRRIAAAFAAKTRAEWDEIFAGAETCYAPVLTLGEAAEHPHAKARDSFVSVAGHAQPAPAPRFSRTEPATPAPPTPAGAHTDEVLADLGLDPAEIAHLRDEQVIGPKLRGARS
jgi:alpha-methylacyl-CoA racemase